MGLAPLQTPVQDMVVTVVPVAPVVMVALP
jgi:hypothetical protein